MLFGILNVTPDSFSDGGRWCAIPDALRVGGALFDEGADVVDVGGDSTRPGSTCVGPDEEWHRIGGVLPTLISRGSVSVDTHHAETARRALAVGVHYINDVTGGGDPSMLDVVAESSASIVLMHAAGAAPHAFASLQRGEAVDVINRFFQERVARALAAGIPASRILLDPGMGAFLSADPEVSWEVLRRIGEVAPTIPLLVGVSRKGFLKGVGEVAITDRDALGGLIAVLLHLQGQGGRPIHIRTHAVALTRRFLDATTALVGSERPPTREGSS